MSEADNVATRMWIDDYQNGALAFHLSQAMASDVSDAWTEGYCEARAAGGSSDSLALQLRAKARALDAAADVLEGK